MPWLLDGFADELTKLARTYTGPGGHSTTVPVQKMQSPAGPKPTRYRPAAPIKVPPPSSPASRSAPGGGGRKSSAGPRSTGMAYQTGFARLGTALKRGISNAAQRVKSAPKSGGAKPAAPKAAPAPQRMTMAQYAGPRTYKPSSSRDFSTTASRAAARPAPSFNFATRASRQSAAIKPGTQIAPRETPKLN